MNSLLSSCVILVVISIPFASIDGQSFESQFSSYGLALPKESVAIRPNVESHVARILVSEGQRVKQGDVLVELSCEAAIAKKKIAQLAAGESGPRMNADAELSYARKNFKKLQALFKRKAVNDREFGEAKLRLERAEATFQIEVEQHSSNQARFELADAELQEFYLKAPFAGQVSQLNVSRGNAVSQNTDVLQLISTNVLRVELYVPIKRSSEFQIGKSLRLKLQEPFSNYDVTGRVVFLSPIIEATTGTLRMLLEIDNRKLQLPAGFTVSLLE